MYAGAVAFETVAHHRGNPCGKRQVLIEGHTDSVGSDESNHELSQRRAQSVQLALAQRGVAGDQITAIGKGENFPIASNDDENGRQSNRRVELIFTEDQPRIAAE